MTEEEAKTKWCPYTTLGDTTEGCIGSGCMAWRWINVSPEADDEIKALGYHPMHRLRGFCGLAGKP